MPTSFPNLDVLLRSVPQTNVDILTPNHRCGRGAWKPSPQTKTANVNAGDEVAFGIERYYASSSTGSQVTYDFVGHIGPGMVYLAKKPDGVELSQWDGDGDWFKIDYKGPATDDSWSLFNQKYYNCMQLEL